MSFFSRLADRNRNVVSQGDRVQMQAAQAAGQQRLMQERQAAEQAAQVAAQQVAQQAAQAAEQKRLFLAAGPQQVAMPRPTAVVGAPQQVAAPAPTAAAAPAPAKLAPVARAAYDPTLAYRRQPPPMMTLAEMDKQRQDTGMYGAMPAVDWRSMKRDL